MRRSLFTRWDASGLPYLPAQTATKSLTTSSWRGDGRGRPAPFPRILAPPGPRALRLSFKRSSPGRSNVLAAYGRCAAPVAGYALPDRALLFASVRASAQSHYCWFLTPPRHCSAVRGKYQERPRARGQQGVGVYSDGVGLQLLTVEQHRAGWRAATVRLSRPPCIVLTTADA